MRIYGLVKALRSNNPLVINLHEWRALGRDLSQARRWRDRWRYLFGPPGWRSDEQGLTSENMRRAAAAAE